MSLYTMIRGRSGPDGFGAASMAEEVSAGFDLSGKTILITGVNSGLGRESARVLALRGARILGAARTRDKASAACEALPGDAVPLACELSDPASVRACVEQSRAYAPIDALLCNAGIMGLRRRTLARGQELQFLTNHVGHFILVTGLLDALADSGRVVLLSSEAHRWAPPEGIRFDDLALERGYKPMMAYGHSKLANLLFARELARRLDGSCRTANAVHPGVIATNLGRHMPWVARMAMAVARSIVLKSEAQGAATQCWAAIHPSLEGVRGAYFADCRVVEPSPQGRDDAMAERLWTVTEQIVHGL